MTYVSSRRAVILSAAVAASMLASAASAQQLTLQKSNSFALGTAFATGTGYGTNPLSVAFDGTSAYIGGYNSSGAAANIGVFKISDVLGAAPTAAGLASSQFLSGPSRGVDAMDFGGGGLFIAHDTTFAGTTPFIRRLNTADGTTLWSIDSPTGARPQAMAVDHLGQDGTPAVAFVTQGAGFVRRLSVADGSVVTPSGQLSIFTSPPGSSYRALDFDSAGNLIYGEDSGVGVGIRETSGGTNYNRLVNVDNPAVNGPTLSIARGGTVTNNVGTGVAILEGATADASKLIVFSNRVTGTGAGSNVALTSSTGEASSVDSKRAQIRLLNGSSAGLLQTELTGAEDGLGRAYTGEIKNFSVGEDANGNPVLLVVDYLTKQLDVYTIEPQFTAAGDGAWSSPSNWTLGIVPDSRTTNATFAAAGAHTVTLDGDRTVKQVKFTGGDYDIVPTGGATLRLAAPANDGHVALVTVQTGSHSIGSKVALETNAQLNVAAGASLTLNTVEGATRNLRKVAAGGVSAAHIRVAALNIDEGTITLTGGASDAGVSRVTALTLGFTPTTGTPTVGNLNVNDSGIIVDYAADATTSPFADLRTAIINGTILSSVATGNKAIGIIDTANSAGPTFSDAALTLDASAVLIRATLKGDSNLDLAVNFDDLLALSQNYEPGNNTKSWAQGDSDYNGTVDFDDLLALAQNYNGSFTSSAQLVASAAFMADWALAQSLVPEPTALSVLGLAGMALGRRRRA